ncbi:helix-turn-helix transcriptional regulator [Companilactobacillus hulinensis]|uniref:helix-turn-helix transcriptional regulator n=1 Tax=Companilactobacillus hulinensis TaxID=2486007 RepID=UPI000F775384|nr:YafY family protein [Companilactobacillus hulinensis]
MRTARLINMIMWLLRTDKVSAIEMAQKFEVSTRTIYRDVDALNLAGIPIFTTQGRNGGIGLMPNYKIDKKLLTANDIKNLRVALSGVRTLIDSPDVNETLRKIDVMYDADNNKNPTLLIDHTTWIGSNELKSLAEKINHSINDRKTIQFEYSDRTGARSTREIEPYLLVYKNERWYIQGFSLERNAFRLFRLSRMKNIDFSGRVFVPREVPASEMTFGNANAKLSKFQSAKILIQAEDIVRDRIVEKFGSDAIKKETKTGFIAELVLPDGDKSYRYVLSFGTHLKILKGESFKRHLMNYLDEVMQIY